ncbi:MAG: GNAT family N-acetyltransferase [Pseudomonadota bacterium]
MSGPALRKLVGAEITAAIPDLARLRIDVFRDFPYLYDGDEAYELGYLEHYAHSAQAVLIAAYDGDWLVGASTAAPLMDHDAAFADALSRAGIDTASTFYCGESVLLPRYRGQGIGHTFFDMREAHARAQGYRQICFCAVLRPHDHPLRPKGYRPLDPFWSRRGYARVPGAVARLAWKDLDQAVETEKPLQVWLRAL